MPRPRPPWQRRLRHHGPRGPPVREEALPAPEMDQPGDYGGDGGCEYGERGGEREEVYACDGAAV